jgi:hypothetical protein
VAQHIGASPCLENLIFSSCNNDKGLREIFKVCGSTLKSLDIRGNVSGENLSKYCLTPPLLKNLSMVCCRKLADKGLLEMLELCGGTLSTRGLCLG